MRVPKLSRILIASAVCAGALLVVVPATHASIPCEITLHGFTADGRQYVMTEDCTEAGGPAETKLCTVGTDKCVDLSGVRTQTVSALSRHPKLRRLGLVKTRRYIMPRFRALGSGPRYYISMKFRGSKTRLGSRTFKATHGIRIKKIYWDQKLRSVAIRVNLNFNVSGAVEPALLTFAVKGLAPAARPPAAKSSLMIETIASCRVLVRIFRCMVVQTPAAQRAAMRRTADAAINKMERALRGKPSARGSFSRSCAVQSGTLRKQFGGNAIYGPCMR